VAARRREPPSSIANLLSAFDAGNIRLQFAPAISRWPQSYAWRGKARDLQTHQEIQMKTVRNVTIAALLAASPLAFAQGGAEGGCQGAKASAEGQPERHGERHAERHAHMAAMHQGMQQGMGMRHGQRHGQEQGKSDKQEEHKH
jgi:hypothetical protein